VGATVEETIVGDSAAHIDMLPDETLDLVVVMASRLDEAAEDARRDAIARRSSRADAAGGRQGDAPAAETPGVCGAEGSRGRHASVVQSVEGSTLRDLAAVSSRLHAACRRHAMTAWASAEALNLPLRLYHPRGELTTMLHLAAANGMEQVALLLLERGAKVDARDSNGRTPLDAARQKMQPALVSLLLAAQAEAARRSADVDDVARRRQASIAAARAAVRPP